MIRRTANISRAHGLGRVRIFISLDPIEEESGSPFERDRLISSHGIPRRGHLCRPCHPGAHTRASASIRDTSVPPGLYVEIREKQSVPFTGNVYMDRLRRPLSPVSRGFRRARHFTYAAGCSRANISGANVTLLDTPVDILVVDFSPLPPCSFCRRRCTAFRASSIHAAVPTGVAPAAT